LAAQIWCCAGRWGKSLTLDDKTYTIIGVVPANFSLFRSTDVCVPIGQWNNPALKIRSAALGLHGFGRIKPGVTIEQAQADLKQSDGESRRSLPGDQQRQRREGISAQGTNDR